MSDTDTEEFVIHRQYEDVFQFNLEKPADPEKSERLKAALADIAEKHGVSLELKPDTELDKKWEEPDTHFYVEVTSSEPISTVDYSGGLREDVYKAIRGEYGDNMGDFDSYEIFYPYDLPDTLTGELLSSIDGYIASTGGITEKYEEEAFAALKQVEGVEIIAARYQVSDTHFRIKDGYDPKTVLGAIVDTKEFDAIYYNFKDGRPSATQANEKLLNSTSGEQQGDTSKGAGGLGGGEIGGAGGLLLRYHGGGDPR